jgi:hypothetical protein
MTIWTVSMTLDTSNSTQSTILNTIRSHVSTYTAYSQSNRTGGTVWLVTIKLDDTQSDEAADLATIYSNVASFTNISIQPTG